MQDDRHLLLVYHVGCCRHIRLGVLVVDRGIDTLDGTSQHAQHLILVVKVRYHISGIDTGKGLVVGILQERRRTDGYRSMGSLEERKEVGYQRVGQLCMQERLQDVFVAGIAQGYLVEVVTLHELVEDVGTEDDGLRYLHGGILELAEVGMHLNDVVEKRQSASFSA